MSLIQLLIWFVAYSTGIAGLSLGAAAYLRSRTGDGKGLLFLLLSFSATVIPTMVNNLLLASGFLWTMRQETFEVLTTVLTVIGFFGAISLSRSFFLILIPGRYRKYLDWFCIGLAAALAAAVFAYLAVPVPFIGLLSVWLTGLALLFLPASALLGLICSLTGNCRRVYGWAGLIAIGFSLYYSKIIPFESFFVLPLFYIGFNSLIIPTVLKKVSARPSLIPDQEILKQLGITPREEEVVQLLLLGLSYKEIAEKLFISLPTVQTHVTRIYQKAGVNSKMELLRLLRP